MDTCGFINAISAIIVVEFYSTHCRLVRAFSSVNKHTCPLAIISVPIDDSFNSQYLVNILTTFLQRFAYLLLNVRSPRDYVVRSSIRPSFVRACGTSLVHWMALQCVCVVLPSSEYFLSPLDGASVRFSVCALCGTIACRNHIYVWSQVGWNCCRQQFRPSSSFFIIGCFTALLLFVCAVSYMSTAFIYNNKSLFQTRSPYTT